MIHCVVLRPSRPEDFNAQLANNVFGHLIFDFALAYILDLIIYSHFFPHHLHHLDAVLSLIDKFNLHAGILKCSFAHYHVVYLGHVVDHKGIRPEPGHVQKIRVWKPPKYVHEVKSFTHLVGYYRYFIPHFAHIAESLIPLTRKDADRGVEMDYQGTRCVRAASHCTNL